MKQILTKLFAHQRLSREQAGEILLNMAKQQYNEAQMAAFITVFLMRPVSLEELLGFRDALLQLCIPVDLEGQMTIDIVGTGGDGKNTFNISTISSLVVAGAGYKVTKHGNYGVSSVSGSSNVLEKLGHRFTNDVDKLKSQLDKANICFFHAPLFHPAMKAVAPIRRQLGVKTFFNMLGPLVNPAQPKYNFFGVYNKELSRLYQYLLQKVQKQFTVVYALDGYDEISLTGPFLIRTEAGEKLFAPRDIGKPQYGQADLSGGDSIDSAAGIFLRILKGEGSPAQTDVVTANAGFAIHCICPEKSIEDCIMEAEESIESGKALKKLRTLTLTD